MADEPDVTETVENPTSIRESVVKSFTDAQKAKGATVVGEEEVETEVEEQPAITPPKKEEKPAEKESEEEDDVVEIDASADEIRNGLTLLRALNNRETAGGALQELARIGGYDLTRKGETRQLIRDTKTILKEKLGERYDILAGDELSDALDALLEDKLAAKTKPFIDRLAESEQRANLEKANSAMDGLWARNKVPEGKPREQVAAKILTKMKQMPAGPEADVNGYLDDLYHLVTRDAEQARTVKKTVTRIKQNAQDVSRTSGDAGGDDEARVRKGSKLPSVREAVAAAFRNERLE